MLLQMTRPVQAGIRQEKHYEVISNHLANGNTSGFKRDVLSFDRVFKATVSVDYSQGALKLTNGKLDLALKRDGFFKVQTPEGLRYTRDGNFMLDPNGNLVTQTGDLVLGTLGPVSIQGSMVNINEAGEVFVDGEGAGALSVVDFDSRENLLKTESNYFEYKGDPGDEVPAENVSVQQGALEAPNTSVVTEMTKLIEVNRMYETIQKVIHTFDELDDKVISDVGRPS